MAKTYDLGEVTAYAIAKKHGYTGTEEQFAAEMTGAATQARAAAQDAEDAEAYATGQRNGTDVPSTDPAYHNNAKYWANTASGANVANAFDTATAYSVGDYVLYNGAMYKFTTAHPAGAWDASHVTAVKAMDEITDLKEGLSESFNDVAVVPEQTNFARYTADALKNSSFDESTINMKKMESLTYYNGRLINSTGYDVYAFRSPYEGFEFEIILNATVYTVDKFPEGVNNEVLKNPVKVTGVQDGAYNKYTIDNLKGTVVLISITKSGLKQIKTIINNHFKMPNLELTDMQDALFRYSIQGSDTSYIPMEVTKLENTLVNTSNGKTGANNSYDTYYFTCPFDNVTFTCTNGFRAVVDSEAPTNSSSLLVRVLYNSVSERITSFLANSGECIVISVSKSQYSNIDLKSNLVKEISLPTLRLTYGQTNGFYNLAKVGTATYLYVYFVSGNKVVQYQLHNVPVIAANSDTWQLGKIMGYDFNGTDISNGVELVTGGEFELAFKEYGSSDYCGGNNHGDEKSIDFILRIDGKEITLSDDLDTAYHPFNRIDAIEHAYVNRSDTPAENILKHQKVWTFENGTVKVKQSLEFLSTLECDFLCCMFAANKSAFNYGARQGRIDTEDLTITTADKISTYGNEMFYIMYGTHACAKITSRTCDHTPQASLWVNRTGSVNKVYYNFYGQNPRTSVESGTVVWWEQEYDVAYN